jgi:hypothetical protein
MLDPVSSKEGWISFIQEEGRSVGGSDHFGEAEASATASNKYQMPYDISGSLCAFGNSSTEC